MDWVARYKKNRWRIMRVSGRSAHRFAILFVLLAAATKKRRLFATDHDTIIKKILLVRRLWFNRAKELMVSGLWQPGAAETKSSADLTARRCLFCRPSCVFYFWGNAARVRPCKYSKICPFCYARVAAYIYWNVRKYINTQRKLNDNTVVACVVQKEFVPVVGFSEESGVQRGAHIENVKNLRAVIEKHVQQYSRQVKTLQRRTSGSMWSLIVAPRRRGWRVETRQFFIGRAGTSFPVVHLPDAKRVYDKSVKISFFVRSGKLLGRFILYPTGMLNECVDFAGIALQATHGMRLRRGTGRLRTCGGSLVAAFKQTGRRNGKKRTEENAKED